MENPKAKLPFEHRYFETYPVQDEQDASWFSKKMTFSIFDLLWKARPNGLTHKEVHEALEKEMRQKIGRSIVYQTLRGLYENKKVKREWDSKANAQRNIVMERLIPASLEEDFEEWADASLKNKFETLLFPFFLDYLEQVMKLAQEKRIPNSLIPKRGKEGWCHNCDTSHEAQFFFLALLYHAAVAFVYAPSEGKLEDKEMRNAIAKLYIDNKLADPKALTP